MRPKQVDTRDDDAHYYLHDDESWTALLKRFNWIAGTTLIVTPFLALYGLLFVALRWQTGLFTLFWYACTGLGITAGYHRLWSHKAWKAVWAVRAMLMVFGTGAVQGSIRWWSRNHRIHHRYTDTPMDPYNARQGFLYSHFGWLLFTKDWSKVKKPSFDVSDLENDPMIMWQNRHYWWLAPFTAFVFPTLLCGLGWGDWEGGYFFGAVLRTVIVHHGTFCVNSLAHAFGDQPFADEHTPRDHFLTALITLGEGYHNFHHEFPFDYRNAIKWYQYDPTKWFIRSLAWLGLAYDLKEFGTNEIQMGVWQMKQKKLDDEKARHTWAPSDGALPTMDFFEFKGRSHNGEKLVVLEGHVVRVPPSLPCGAALHERLGKDVSADFDSKLHAHSAEARGMAKMRRIAVLSGIGAREKQQ